MLQSKESLLLWQRLNSQTQTWEYSIDQIWFAELTDREEEWIAELAEREEAAGSQVDR
jgi:hypothetical protein